MRSLFGSSGAMCVEAAQHGDHYRPAERTTRIETPGPKDAIPAGMCATCGFPGPHAGARECIDALRDRIAVLEFNAGAGRRRPRASSVQAAQRNTLIPDVQRT